MEFAVIKSGIIKSKKYCPNPVVKYGIPSYADSITNPKCKGTPAYNQWWEEQIYYIVNGYSTGGIHLPGRYYKFVNFDTIRGLAGANMRAELHDFQLDYAYLIEQAKTEHKNIIIPKARRKTCTTMNVCMVIDYGYRFQLNYKGAIVAGQEKFATIFYNEWKYLDSKVHAEFRIKNIGGKEDTVAGWKQKLETGENIESGTRNTIYQRTVYHDSGVLKGLTLDDIVLEESGENELLQETYYDSRDCLMLGSEQYGTFHIYGTGGDMNKGSKGFRDIWYNADKFNCLKLFIPATVFFFPYYAGAVDPKTGKNKEEIPNLQHLQPHQRVGWSDEVRALIEIERLKKFYLDSADLDLYFKHCQNNPTDVKEVFRKSSGNNFDIMKLNDQGHRIMSEEPKYRKYKLVEKEDQPGEVFAELANDTTPERECVLILDNGHPVPEYRYLDVAGIDSYDQDQSKNSKSLGAMVVFRRLHNIGNTPQWCPVAIIRNRPPRKEDFYEMCRKLAIYYNMIDGVLVDVANGVIIQYFKEMNCQRYLSKAPKKFESPNSEAMNEYGMRLTGFSKPRMISALQSFFFSHVEKIWFIKIIEEALDYDEVEVDSDNDIIDALGLALMKAMDMNQIVISEKDLYASNPYQYPEWGINRSGNIVDKTLLKEMNEKEPLGKYEDYFSRIARIEKNEPDEDSASSDIYSL